MKSFRPQFESVAPDQQKNAYNAFIALSQEGLNPNAGVMKAMSLTYEGHVYTLKRTLAELLAKNNPDKIEGFQRGILRGLRKLVQEDKENEAERVHGSLKSAGYGQDKTRLPENAVAFLTQERDARRAAEAEEKAKRQAEVNERRAAGRAETAQQHAILDALKAEERAQREAWKREHKELKAKTRKVADLTDLMSGDDPVDFKNLVKFCVEVQHPRLPALVIKINDLAQSAGTAEERDTAKERLDYINTAISQKSFAQFFSHAIGNGYGIRDLEKLVQTGSAHEGKSEDEFIEFLAHKYYAGHPGLQDDFILKLDQVSQHNLSGEIVRKVVYQKVAPETTTRLIRTYPEHFTSSDVNVLFDCGENFFSAPLEKFPFVRDLGDDLDPGLVRSFASAVWRWAESAAWESENLTIYRECKNAIHEYENKRSLAPK